MTSLFTRLISILEKQCELYSTLFELSIKKREAIENQNIELLDKVLRDEQPLLIQLTESERERVGIVASFKTVFNLPEEIVTIRSIIEICPPSYLSRLNSVYNELVSALGAQKKINDINKRLIESRLEYINFMTDTAAGSTTNSYGTDGTDTRPKNTGSRIIDLGV